MEEKEFTVVVHRGTNIEELEKELTSEQGSSTVPARRVNIANTRKGSTRQTHFALTQEEADILLTDDRVLTVQIPAEKRTDIDMHHNISQTGVFWKTSSDSGNYQNWGLKRINSQTLNFGGSGAPTDANPTVFTQSYDGTGVDIVIQDSGIEANHPEWQDANGVTRLQQINWYTESGISGTQSANHYRDYDGHGTHCAGIAAGKTFGWAKNAKIFAQKLNGLEGTGDSGTGISITNAFDTIRQWHKNKSGANANRPTVVNMSWGYGWNRTPAGITNGNYRGSAWNFATDYSSNSATLYSAVGFTIPLYGSGTYTRVPIRVADVDADIQEMVDAGIHITIAAGNQLFKIDTPAGADWNNTIYRSSTASNEYYHRGSSPYDDECYIVGNIDSGLVSGLDHRAFSSNTGPGTNIWAPGSDIMSACSNINDKNGQDYYPDSNFKQCNIGGTSMAAPQVAGVCALFLQRYGYDKTPAELKTLIQAQSTNIIYDSGNADDYDDTNTIHGSPNRLLFNQLNSEPMSVTGPFTINGPFTLSQSYTEPAYQLSRSADSASEGTAFTITLSTLNVPSGTSVPYTITGVTSADINGASLTGNFVVGSSDVLTVNVTADESTEGTETFTIALNNGRASNSVLINDTSLDTTYSLSVLSSNINEGQYATFQLSTTGLAQGTLVPYTVTGISSADIGGGSLTGNFTINSLGNATALYYLTDDLTTEGTETMTMTLDNGQASASVTINDTSVGFVPDYTINVTATGASAYILSGGDRNGAVSGNNPTLAFNNGDKVRFSNNVSGSHPLYIKTVQGTGTGNGASGVTGQGTATVDWTIGSTGTFYYQCTSHNSMNNTITVS